MDDNFESPAFEFDLENKGGRLRFISPEECERHFQEEQSRWNWFGTGILSEVARAHEQHISRLMGICEEWRKAVMAQGPLQPCDSPLREAAGVVD
jgi:hypothetical protein